MRDHGGLLPVALLEAALHHAGDHLKMKLLTDFVMNFMEELRSPLNLMSNRTP